MDQNGNPTTLDELDPRLAALAMTPAPAWPTTAVLTDKPSASRGKASDLVIPPVLSPLRTQIPPMRRKQCQRVLPDSFLLIDLPLSTLLRACPVAAQNVVGIGASAAAGAAVGPDSGVSYGTVLVTLDNPASTTIGDVVCTSTTAAGQGHDNAQTACAGTTLTLGVVIATSGSIIQMAGTGAPAAIAASTTLPLVQPRIGR